MLTRVEAMWSGGRGGQSVILVSRRRLWTRWRIPRRRWRRKRTQTVTTMRTKDCVKKKRFSWIKEQKWIGFIAHLPALIKSSSSSIYRSSSIIARSSFHVDILFFGSLLQDLVYI